MDFFIIVLYVFLGILFGIITGLTPGLHPNTIAAIAVGFSFNPFLISVVIISAAITHTFLDFIPSIFLGAPDPGTAMSVLPGHELMMKGRGYEAIKLTVVGGIVSLIITIIILPGLILFIKNFYDIIRTSIPWILVMISSYMFLKDKKIWGIVVFTLAGVFGYIVLRNNFIGDMVLFPMLTGLFGISTIIYSLRRKTKIPEQGKDVENVEKNEYLLGGLIGSLSGILVGLLPGIGSAQASFLSREIIKDNSNRKFMIAIGGVNTTVAILSLLALWLIGTPRSGVASVVGRLLDLSLGDVVVFMGVMIMASGIAGLITILIGKKSVHFFKKINYIHLNVMIIVLLAVMIFVFTGLWGLLIASLSTVIGLFCIFSGTRRTYLMACLIVPTVLFFIGL
ncbi:MAG: tripartite tricarboxylate transporter permease [Candidatus Aenigmarchaeota archaeon]|nr:tripartite tricarboxylate transporter permease [Candidatus Aenigmarchaeota archaeon]